MKHFLLGCLLSASIIPRLSMAQTAQLTEQLGKTVLYGDIALSPDGQHVAWVQSTAATTTKETYVLNSSGKGSATKVNLNPPHDVSVANADQRTDFDPIWSPDSKWLAFFSTAGMPGGQRQLWRANADGSPARLTTALVGYAARPRWSPDGKQIAFLYIEGAEGGGPLVAAPPTTGVIDKAIHNQRIAVLDALSGEVRQVSPADLHVYDFDWSPDGRSFVVTAAPGPGDNNWWIAQIYKIDIGKGSAMAIYKPQLQIAVPRWSPDGKSIAFIEGLMSDEGFHGGDLFTVPASGGKAVSRTPGRKTSLSSVFWLAPDRVVTTEYVGGGGAISELNLADNSVRTIWKGDESFHAFGNFPDFALAAAGNFTAAVRSTYNTPPEVWAGPVGQWRQLTSNNSSLAMTWGKAESVEWTNEGFHIQGWLLPPAKVESGKKYPMVVLIHGGPSGVTGQEWPASFGMSRAIIAGLSSNGYYVLLPNPRGSYGQGEQFTRANVKDFGHGDLRDSMAGIDAVLKKYPIDPAHLGVTGWSYGGYMTAMALLTAPEVFRVGVAGAPVADWDGYDTHYTERYLGHPDEEPEAYRRSSVLQDAASLSRPMMLIHGLADDNVIVAHTLRLSQALLEAGRPHTVLPLSGVTHMTPQEHVAENLLLLQVAFLKEALRPEERAADQR